MNADWTTTRKIVCLNDSGERVLVFRQHSPGIRNIRLSRYVLGNGAPVEVVADSRFCVVESRIVLRPMNV